MAKISTRKLRPCTTPDVSTLHYGDNLDVLRRDIRDESVDLVYLDPPFNSDEAYNLIYKTPLGGGAKAQIQAFGDTWTWGPETDEQFRWLTEGGASSRVADLTRAFVDLFPDRPPLLAYLLMMMPRLVELRRVLKPTGTLWLHCDPIASHYLKVALDAVFGVGRCVNEVIWQRSTGKSLVSRRLARNHDVLLAFSKTDAWKWNADSAFVAYDPDNLDAKTSSKYSHQDADGRVYRLDNLINPNTDRPNLTYEFLGIKRVWRWTRERMEAAHKAGLVVQTKPGGVPQLKRYLDEQRGRPLGDVWIDIPPINSQADEDLGYPTQKPVALLERVLALASSEGDVVLDPFCGCGTTIEAAERMKREWIGIDVTYIAVDLIQKRMHSVFGANLRPMTVKGIPRDVEGAHALFAKNPFDFERWAVSMVDGQPNEKQVGDRGLDGVIRFPFAKDEAGKAIVSVKGGQQVNPAMVRDLVGTVATEHAAMGVLIVMDKPTPGMLSAAKGAGQCSVPMLERSFPKIQIFTVGELLDGKRPAMPTPFLPYVKAKYKPSAQMPLL